MDALEWFESVLQNDEEGRPFVLKPQVGGVRAQEGTTPKGRAGQGPEVEVKVQVNFI